MGLDLNKVSGRQQLWANHRHDAAPLAPHRVKAPLSHAQHVGGVPQHSAIPSPAQSTQATHPANLVAWNFDFDDNVLFLDTQIYLFHKDTGEEIAISTRTWATERHVLGKSG